MAVGHTDLNPRVLTYPTRGGSCCSATWCPACGTPSTTAAPDRPEWAGQASIYVASPNGSWALAEYIPAGGPSEAARHGPDDLWAQIGSAWNTWCTAG